MTTTGAHLPSIYLTQMAAHHPGCWRRVDELRAARHRSWPSWCFLPLAGALEVLAAGRHDHSEEEAISIGRQAHPFAALAAWRATQGIYEFHAAVRDAIAETPLDGDLPCELLHRVPEWCVYLRTSGMQIGPWKPEGAFVFLNWEASSGREDLRIALDAPPELLCLPAVQLHLGTIAAGITATYDDARARERIVGRSLVPSYLPSPSEWALIVAPVISLVLYLCAENSEIDDAAGRAASPRNPVPTATKQGPRTFPPPKPTTWNVAFRVGSALERSCREPRSDPQGGTHARPRPHIRRAHYNTYWTGPRSGLQVPVLRWLAPTIIGTGPLVPVIRGVGNDE
jgi:hypothetical protein